MPSKNASRRVFLNPYDIVETTRTQAVYDDICEELLQPTPVPYSFGKKGIHNVGPLKIQYPMAALQCKTLFFGVLDYSVAFCPFEKCWKTNAIETLEINRLKASAFVKDFTQLRSLLLPPEWGRRDPH